MVSGSQPIERSRPNWIVENLWEDPWGIFAVAPTNLEALRKHFRRFLKVEDPDGKEMLFRFYDPRVLPTFLTTAVEAVDKLRDTAESHERLFLVEVMGRHSGYIALYTALAAGAEVVCIPETDTDIPLIVEHLKQLKERGKT